MKQSITMFLLLMLTWLLWSGHYEPLILGFGVASCALVIFVVRRMAGMDKESQSYTLALRSVTYIPWLVWEIVKANIAVAKSILSPSVSADPHLVRTTATQKTDLGKVIYANSITLTPGTLTLDMRGDSLLIHSLTREAAEDVLEGSMDRHVTRMEGKG